MINNLPEKLKALRLKNNLSQKTISDYLELSPSIISAYELGTRTPSLEIILKLAGLYRCTTDYLLGRENTPPKAVFDVDGLTDAQIQALQNLIQTMKNEGK